MCEKLIKALNLPTSQGSAWELCSFRFGIDLHSRARGSPFGKGTGKVMLLDYAYFECQVMPGKAGKASIIILIRRNAAQVVNFALIWLRHKTWNRTLRTISQ